VTRADTGETVERLSGEHGFIRSVMRGMARERRAQDVGHEPPFRLMRWSDGRITLDDPQTGRWVALDAFGPDNAGAFGALLRKARRDRTLSGALEAPARDEIRRD